LAALAVLVPTMAPNIAKAATLAELAEWCGNSAESHERLWMCGRPSRIFGASPESGWCRSSRAS